MQDITISSVTLSAAGTGKLIPINFKGMREWPPAIICTVSPGATLTFNVEVTGDDLQAAGYAENSGNWVPFTGMAGLTASAVATLGALITGIRLNCTTYSSGSVNMTVDQVSA